jgi:hypothetical protein
VDDTSSSHHVDRVTGGGLDLDRRLAIVRAVFLASEREGSRTSDGA